MSSDYSLSNLVNTLLFNKAPNLNLEQRLQRAFEASLDQSRNCITAGTSVLRSVYDTTCATGRSRLTKISFLYARITGETTRMQNAALAYERAIEKHRGTQPDIPTGFDLAEHRVCYHRPVKTAVSTKDSERNFDIPS
jgi:hypothetical protein